MKGFARPSPGDPTVSGRPSPTGTRDNRTPHPRAWAGSAGASGAGRATGGGRGRGFPGCASWGEGKEVTRLRLPEPGGGGELPGQGDSLEQEEVSDRRGRREVLAARWGRVLRPGFLEPRGGGGEGGAPESEGLLGAARKSSRDPRSADASTGWGRSSRVGSGGLPEAVGLGGEGNSRGSEGEEFRGVEGAAVRKEVGKSSRDPRGVGGSVGGGRPLAAAHHDGSGAWSPEGRRAGLRPGGRGRVTGRAASRTWVTGCKGGSATDGPAKMSPMETRPAGAARAVGQGRKWEEEGRKATRKTVLSELSGEVPGRRKVQSTGGGEG